MNHCFQIEYEVKDSSLLLVLNFATHVQNGIIRLDLVRLFNGKVLLLEIEDNSPYLALPEKALSPSTKQKALDALARSIRTRFYASKA